MFGKRLAVVVVLAALSLKVEAFSVSKADKVLTGAKTLTMITVQCLPVAVVGLSILAFFFCDDVANKVCSEVAKLTKFLFKRASLMGCEFGLKFLGVM